MLLSFKTRAHERLYALLPYNQFIDIQGAVSIQSEYFLLAVTTNTDY